MGNDTIFVFIKNVHLLQNILVIFLVFCICCNTISIIHHAIQHTMYESMICMYANNIIIYMYIACIELIALVLISIFTNVT